MVGRAGDQPAWTKENFMTNPAEPAPLPKPTHIPDDPTKDEARAILATLDDMAVLEQTGDTIAKRTNPRQRQSAEERIWLAIQGVEEGWALVFPLR